MSIVNIYESLKLDFILLNQSNAECIQINPLARTKLCVNNWLGMNAFIIYVLFFTLIIEIIITEFCNLFL